MAARARRSAGTNTYVNRLLFRKSRPELDIENFRNGVAFKVTGLIKSLAVDAASGLDGGYLHIGQGQPVVWRGRGSVSMALTGPFELHEMSSGNLPFGASLTKCLLSTGQGDFELTVPKTDLDLVRLGLASAAEKPVATAQSARSTAHSAAEQVVRKGFRSGANFAMIAYFLGLLGISATKPIATGWTAALVFIWLRIMWTVVARLPVPARIRLRPMLLRDPRVIRDAVLSALYIVGLPLVVWIPNYLGNFWVLGIGIWIVVALVTMAVRFVLRSRPSAA